MGEGVRVNVRVVPPWGYSRVFLTFLTVVARTGILLRSVLSAHVPEVRISGLSVLKLDTGGERWDQNPKVKQA